jgi:hypothetical protein
VQLSGERSPAGNVYRGPRSALPEAWLHPCDDRTHNYQTTRADVLRRNPVCLTGTASCARSRATVAPVRRRHGRASLSRTFTQAIEQFNTH